MLLFILDGSNYPEQFGIEKVIAKKVFTFKFLAQIPLSYIKFNVVAVFKDYLANQLDNLQQIFFFLQYFFDLMGKQGYRK